MAENVTNELIYETLRAIRSEVADLGRRMERLEDRMAHVEGLMGDLVKADLSRNAEMTDLERRVARIERCLELNDGAA